MNQHDRDEHDGMTKSDAMRRADIANGEAVTDESVDGPPEPAVPPPTRPLPDLPDQPTPLPMPGDPPSDDRAWPDPSPPDPLPQLLAAEARTTDDASHRCVSPFERRGIGTP
jgi:hypothetical protein